MYVIFNPDTTRFLHIRTPHRGVGTTRTHFETRAAAKAGLTRYQKKNPTDTVLYQIMSTEEFAAVEKTHVVHSVINGAAVVESVNTPYGCSVGDEAYWSR